MKIVVCLKQILDPELAPQDFSIDAAVRRPMQGCAKLVMDSYAENALELAIQLKERNGGQVVALCLGDKSSDDALRRALAFSADEAVRVWDTAWEDLDARTVAHVLSRAIRQSGGADLVLCGRQAGDVERGLVGPMLAEELGFACTTMAGRLELGEVSVRALRETDYGKAWVDTRLPAVVTVTNDETNVPRLPKVRDIMMAARKPIRVLGASELGVDPEAMGPGLALRQLYIPVMETRCEIVEGDDGPAKATALMDRLREMKAL